VNRADWQRIAEEKLIAAKTLLDARQWPSAYYLAGYALECGLKSCILTHLEDVPEIIFDDGNKTYSEKCWSHDVERLVELAGLREARQRESTINPDLLDNWMVAKDWNERSRYEIQTQ
jgi:hypothetical protein